MTMAALRGRYIATWIMLGIVLSSVGCSSAGTPVAGPTPIPPTPSLITVLNPPRQVADFQLTNQDGTTTRLSDMKGHMVLLTFGYTHCPDICPVTLAKLKQIKEQLGKDADQVTFVFISVDGARDTPARLKEYLPLFDKDFIGLTGSEEVMREVAKDYGVIFIIKNAGGLKDNYPVEHTAGTYLVNRDGQWMRKYAYDADPTLVVQDIEKAMAS